MKPWEETKNEYHIYLKLCQHFKTNPLPFEHGMWALEYVNLQSDMEKEYEEKNSKEDC